MAEIRKLNPDHVHQANYNSFGGTRGDSSNASYMHYAESINGWSISEEKKQKLLDKLYEKYSRLISLEAQHVSVAVAGPARYNPRKLDKSDPILELSAEISDWYASLARELERSAEEKKDDEAERLVERIFFLDSRYPATDPTADICRLATLDVEKFKEVYEQLQPKYKWRKNSSISKLYGYATEGKLVVAEKKEIYSNADFTAYEYNDRVFIKFTLKPQRQLIVALKSRGYWWNSGANAWSTYAEKADREWIKTISDRYGKYI